MKPIHIVELTVEEQVPYDSIPWESDDWIRWDYDKRIEMLENVKTLSESLIHRQAVPKIRLDYFIEPEMNLGGRGKSRKQNFENSGTTGTDILRHPNFMPYLWYFINGPKLPKRTIEGFCQIIEDDRGTSGMVLNQICTFVRKAVRDQRLPHDASDEFAKLAFEIDQPQLADSVRKAAMSVRK